MFIIFNTISIKTISNAGKPFPSVSSLNYFTWINFQIATVRVWIKPGFRINPWHIGNIINHDSAITF